MNEDCNKDEKTYTVKVKLSDSDECNEFISELNKGIALIDGVFGKLTNGVICEEEEVITFEWEPEMPDNNTHKAIAV